MSFTSRFLPQHILCSRRSALQRIPGPDRKQQREIVSPGMLRGILRPTWEIPGGATHGVSRVPFRISQSPFRHPTVASVPLSNRAQLSSPLDGAYGVGDGRLARNGRRHARPRLGCREEAHIVPALSVPSPRRNRVHCAGGIALSAAASAFAACQQFTFYPRIGGVAPWFSYAPPTPSWCCFPQSPSSRSQKHERIHAPHAKPQPHNS